VYFSPNIIIMVKSRRMRCAGLVTRVGIRGMDEGLCSESQKEREH
jgi:hypothetical protein